MPLFNPALPALQPGNNLSDVGNPVTAFRNISPEALYVRGAAIIGETTPRNAMLNTAVGLSLSQLYLTAVALPAGAVVGHIAYATATSGITGPSHWWFGLYDSSLNQLAVTADQGSTAWASNTYQSLAIATIAAGSSTTFTTTYTGLYYAGIMINASGAPNLIGGGHAAAAVIAQSPVLNGSSDAAQTTPPAFPHQATALTAVASIPYAVVAA